MAYDRYPAINESDNFPPEVRQAMALYPELLQAFAAKTLETTVGNHLGDAGNPHFTTAAQVGLGNVDNTADTAKPVSAAQLTALNAKAPIANPTFTGTVGGVTKAMVGLGNVDNTSDANKPLPTSMLNLPKGLVAIAESSVGSASSTNQQIILNIPTFTFVANRWYEIEWNAAIVNQTGGSNSVLAQLYSCAVADAANALTGLTELAGFNTLFTAAAQTVKANPKRKIKFGTNTTLQIKAALNGVGQNSYVAAGGTWPTQLSITDIGQQI